MLEWYRPRRRMYPWRRGSPDPYAVLVSEVMLQQTQASRVVPAFDAFLARFPDFGSLASASRADVLRLWGSLGYNRRPIALHETARIVCKEHGGELPRAASSLLELPGVGPYTAAAVASIAFGEPVAAVDTNVRRVLARVVHGAEPEQVPHSTLRADADAMLGRRRARDWNQALMDLGREICRPRPRCDECPLAGSCAFRAVGRTGGTRSPRQSPFEGSFRQLRGAVVRELRASRSATPSSLAATIGRPAGRVVEAVEALLRDGVLERASGGRVRLHR